MEFRAIEVEDTAPPGEPFPGTDTGIYCVVCNTPLVYGGRGPKPKYCDDHKKKSHSSGGGRKAVPTDLLISQIDALYIGTAAGLCRFQATATDGMVVANAHGQLAESWRTLIERDPKVRKFWERVCTGGGWGTVIVAHGLIALAIANNHGGIPGMPKSATNTEAPTA